MPIPLAVFLQAVFGLAPMIVALVPGGATVAPFLPLIMKGITDAEATTQPGAAKRAAVVQLVADAAAGANAAKPDTVSDPALLAESTGHVIDAILGSVNAVQAAVAVLPPAPSLIGKPATA